MSLTAARERLRSALGSALAERATDRFAMAFWGEPSDSFRALGLPSDVGRTPAIVIELPQTDPPGEPGLSRRDRVFRARDWFYGRHQGLITALEGVGLSSQDVQVCWLAAVIRVVMPMEGLRMLRADAVHSLDIPRRVTRELSESAVAVGAPSLRAKHNVDGSGVKVGIIDGEIALGHPTLPRVTRRLNFSAEPWGTPDHHATVVAGIVGSAHEEFRGVAPGATLFNYKIFAQRHEDNADDVFAMSALDAALEDDVDVVNCSWGTNGPIDGSSREARAFNRAWRHGLVIVKSAGNDGPEKRTITCPADADGVITVGATRRSGKHIWTRSSRGPTAHNIPQTRPHLLAPGGSFHSHIRSTVPEGTIGVAVDGTSNAAPHVTGLAALLLQVNPTATPDMIRDTLLANCVPLPDLDENDQGKGRVDFSTAIG